MTDNTQDNTHNNELNNLDIDWESYHPQAPKILPLPFLWSNIDEFSPHGNDTGHDTLSYFMTWHKQYPKISAMVFFKELMAVWEIDITQPYESNYSTYTYYRAIIAVCFASIKMSAVCEKALVADTLIAIDNHLAKIAGEADWGHRQECEEKLLQMQEIIKKIPTT